MGQTVRYNNIDFWKVRARDEHKGELHQPREEVEGLKRLKVLVKTDDASK